MDIPFKDFVEKAYKFVDDKPDCKKTELERFLNEITREYAIGDSDDQIVIVNSPVTMEKYKEKLPLNLRLRATHWYDEFDRVIKGVEAFRQGDIEEYGRLSFESGYSSIHNHFLCIYILTQKKNNCIIVSLNF